MSVKTTSAANSLKLLMVACLCTAGSAVANNKNPQSPDAEQCLEPIRVSFVTEDNFVIVGGYTPPAGTDVKKIAARVKTASKKVDKSSKSPTPRQLAAALCNPEAKAPMIILLHMYKHDRSSYDPLIPILHKAGFACLAIDLRGHGDSVGPDALHLKQRVDRQDKNLFATMDRDVAAAFSWLVQQNEVDPTRVAFIGASVGCSVALDYARHDPSIDGVVCMTPGTDYLGIDSIKHAKEYGRRPLFLLAGKDEQTAAKKLGKITPGSKVKISPSPTDAPKAIHGTRMFGKVPNVEKHIVDFLKEALGPPPSQPVVASINSNIFHSPDSGIANRIKPENRRWLSSPVEARQRGLRPPKR
jgi:pimeloyl-ACP methyl ester carboxylesterase